MSIKPGKQTGVSPCTSTLNLTKSIQHISTLKPDLPCSRLPYDLLSDLLALVLLLLDVLDVLDLLAVRAVGLGHVRVDGLLWKKMGFAE